MDYQSSPPGCGCRYAAKLMKSLALLVVALAAFAVGRVSVPEPALLPSVPIAFVQATQPIAVTIDVDVASRDAAGGAQSGVYQLEGTAEYRFTNLTDQPVQIAFPPARTFSISSTSIGSESVPSPLAIAKSEIVEIPASDSITRSGRWSTTVTGDPGSFLKAGAGRHGFVCSSPQGADCFAGTLIGFQAFKHVAPASQCHTIEGHLEAVSSTAIH